MVKSDILFTFEQAARTMGVTPERLGKLIDEGKVPAIQEGPRTYVPRESILAYMAEVTSIGKKTGVIKKATPAKEAD